MYQPSNSKDGKLRKETNKSGNIDFIQMKCGIMFNYSQPSIETKIFDGAVVIHMVVLL